jgi:hypothetical protein
MGGEILDRVCSTGAYLLSAKLREIGFFWCKQEKN